ncbi:AtaL-like protein [Craterilacuibacter sp.]|uniref:AtaL-like protein n=1 Tax=Craterilacuibacter sp. TaxID=2870909 RepID=UPI003F37DECC
MVFEHLVAVNDPSNPLALALSRDTLWQGLLRRAELPKEFVESLDEDIVLEAGADYSERAWAYGQYRVQVRVEMQAQECVIYRTHPLPDNEGGCLCMQIEEPLAGDLFVRFSYETPVPDEPVDGVDVASYLRSAYQQTDIDLIRAIRKLAETGQIG